MDNKELQHKYDVMLLAFIGLLMKMTGCNQEEAALRVASLCACIQTDVFDKSGEPITTSRRV
jgi:hypothetical protein